MTKNKWSTKKKIMVGGFLVLLFLAANFYLRQVNDSDSVADNSASLTERVNQLQQQDTDGDGLSDQDEKLYNTDPRNPDTDGDGYQDGQEVKSGYSPLKASPGDKIDDPNEFVANLDPKPNLIIPEDSEINISNASGKEAVIKYFEDAQTPLALKDPLVYREALAGALSGDTTKADELILELELKYRQLKKMAVPAEVVKVHKLTLALMPTIIQLFKDFKYAKEDPTRTILSIKSSEDLSPYTLTLQNEINKLAKKYNIVLPD